MQLSNVRNLGHVHVVVANVEEDAIDKRSAMNAIESIGFSSMEDVLEYLSADCGLNIEEVFIFSLSEFMEDYNDDKIDIDNSFMSYVVIQ